MFGFSENQKRGKQTKNIKSEMVNGTSSGEKKPAFQGGRDRAGVTTGWPELVKHPDGPRGGNDSIQFEPPAAWGKTPPTKRSSSEVKKTFGDSRRMGSQDL